jgi:hypothetical protein
MRQSWLYRHNIKIQILFWLINLLYFSIYFSDTKTFLKTGYLFLSTFYVFTLFVEIKFIEIVWNSKISFLLKLLLGIFLLLVFGNILKFTSFFSLKYAFYNLDLGYKKDFYDKLYSISQYDNSHFFNILEKIRMNPFPFLPFHLPALTFYSVLWLNKTSTELLQIENSNLELELNLIKSKVNPIIINKAFNYIKKESPELGQQMVLRLSYFLRHLLYSPETNSNTVEAELDFLVNFLEIAEQSLKDDLNIDYKIKKLGSGRNTIKSLSLYPILSEIFFKAKSFVDLNILLENHLLQFDIAFDIKPEESLSDFEIFFEKDFERNYSLFYEYSTEIKNFSLSVKLKNELHEKVQLLNR